MSGHTRFDVVCVGESLGLFTVARPGHLHNAAEVRLGFGGAESNVAIGVARLGGRSAWIGRLGTDAMGDLIERELRAENVATYIRRDPHRATAFMLKHHQRPHTSRITYYRRDQAGSRLDPTDLPPAEVIEQATILHVTGITAALGKRPAAAIDAAIATARSAGTLVSFDVNHRSTLWPEPDVARRVYRELARHADIVFAGDDEAELVTGQPDSSVAARALLELGSQCAVIKRGAHGAMALTVDGHAETAAALPVPVIDTVGAGDAFVAGWLSATSRSLPLAARMQTAIACGAWACTNAGDWEGTPTREDLDTLAEKSTEPVTR